MASFSSLALTALEICAFKVQKTGRFWGQNLFLSFKNWFLSSYFAIFSEPLDPNSSLTHFGKQI